MTATPADVALARNLRPAALSALREGRVTILTVISDDNNTPVNVIARIDGHTGRHVVDYLDGEWTCTCRKWINGERRPCAHVIAVRLVTGQAAA